MRPAEGGMGGPQGLARPLVFSSTSFKETEQRYLEWEKGLLSLTRAVKEAERLHTSQDIIVQGPFPLLNSVLKGSPPPEGAVQKATIQKWYAYSEGVSQSFNNLLSLPYKPSPIKEAPEPTQDSDTQGLWFTDASARGVGPKWQYKAAAVEIATGTTMTEEGEGSAQVGELCALSLAAEGVPPQFTPILLQLTRVPLSGYGNGNPVGGKTTEGWIILLFLLVATATNTDDLDLDGNIVAKMMVGFAQMMNLTL
ncbi:hypothetical protein QYF61_025339, partial [Mycteria americana]